MTNQKLLDVPTPVSNTGLNSQSSFVSTVDWLDFIVRDIQSGSDVDDFLSMLSTVTSDNLPRPDGLPRFCGEMWSRSYRSEGGIQLDYNPPISELYYPASELEDQFAHVRWLNSMLPDPGTRWEKQQLCELNKLGGDYYELHFCGQPVTARGDHPLLVFNSSRGKTWFKWEKKSREVIAKPGKLRVSISGSSMKRCDISALMTWLAIQRDTYQIECTRLDLALDDMRRQTKREDIDAAVNAGNYAGVVVANPHVPRHLGKIKGWTYYFGSTQSDSMMRIYDKFHESKGENPAIRWELQLRRDKANSAFIKLLLLSNGTPSESAQFIASTVLGEVSFVDRSTGDKNLSRCSILPWFQQLIEVTTEPIKLRVKKETTTLQRSINYVAKVARKVFAKMEILVGYEDVCEFVGGLIDEGHCRLTRADKRELQHEGADELILTPDDRRDWARAEGIARERMIPLADISVLVPA